MNVSDEIIAALVRERYPTATGWTRVGNTVHVKLPLEFVHVDFTIDLNEDH